MPLLLSPQHMAGVSAGPIHSRKRAVLVLPAQCARLCSLASCIPFLAIVCAALFGGALLPFTDVNLVAKMKVRLGDNNGTSAVGGTALYWSRTSTGIIGKDLLVSYFPPELSANARQPIRGLWADPTSYVDCAVYYKPGITQVKPDGRVKCGGPGTCGCVGGSSSCPCDSVMPSMNTSQRTYTHLVFASSLLIMAALASLGVAAAKSGRPFYEESKNRVLWVITIADTVLAIVGCSLALVTFAATTGINYMSFEGACNTHTDKDARALELIFTSPGAPDLDISATCDLFIGFYCTIVGTVLTVVLMLLVWWHLKLELRKRLAAGDGYPGTTMNPIAAR